ncbi:hypothetical protein [Oceanicaulis sp. MMSF_3324]|uniref:hypothetical protein n=1 Tax=Oceanicaulis sp. MMSF_3324 TaxID=3046702 RepID=UPI00273E79C8|nr:hypothetical protein [Oceanicaulis sp. MMSF_3324]
MNSDFKNLVHRTLPNKKGNVLIGVSQIQIDRKLEYMLFSKKYFASYEAETFSSRFKSKLKFTECEQFRSELLDSVYTEDFVVYDGGGGCFWINSLRDNISVIYVENGVHIPQSLIVEWDSSLANEIIFGGLAWDDLLTLGVFSYFTSERLNSIREWIKEY